VANSSNLEHYILTSLMRMSQSRILDGLTKTTLTLRLITEMLLYNKGCDRCTASVVVGCPLRHIVGTTYTTISVYVDRYKRFKARPLVPSQPSPTTKEDSNPSLRLYLNVRSPPLPTGTIVHHVHHRFTKSPATQPHRHHRQSPDRPRPWRPRYVERSVDCRLTLFVGPPIPSYCG
jgi:hypothetical protein